MTNIPQIIGHALIVLVYIAPLPLAAIGASLKDYDDPVQFWLFLVVPSYILSHLISAGIIK